MLINADIHGDKDRGEKILEDLRLHGDRVRVPPARQLRETPRTLSHDPSGYKENPGGHVQADRDDG